MAQKRKGPSTGAEAGVLLGGEHIPHIDIAVAAQRWSLALARFLGSWSAIRRRVRQSYHRPGKGRAQWTEASYV
jgi:hypothetical protein